jgi:hypothetical protein
MTTTSSVYRKVVLGMLVFTTMCAVGTRGVLAAADDEERERVEEAAQVLRELARADDAEAIPEELFERAKAIAVVPGVVRGAFVIGGRWGKRPRRTPSPRPGPGRASAPPGRSASGWPRCRAAARPRQPW